jgi:hypothetical protein
MMAKIFLPGDYASLDWMGDPHGQGTDSLIGQGADSACGHAMLRKQHGIPIYNERRENGQR